MIIRRCLTLRGFHNYAPRHLEAAVQFLARRRDLPWAALIAPATPLSEIGDAFDRATSGRWHRAAITPNS
jgi:threonine dehydrogenase-like Zn-dependent dehydrogenase